MALGGSNLSWDENTPAGSESVGLGDDRIRSMKTSVRNALDSEHVFSSSGGTAGQHRAGSARAFYGIQSTVSASDTSNVADGRMMIASDSSKLFGVNSLGTVMLGAGPFALSVGSMVGVTLPQRAYVAVEFGEVTSAASTHQVTFPGSGFSGIPFVMASAHTETLSGDKPGRFVRLIGVSKTEFSAQVISTENGDAVTAGIFWFSIGTRTL